MTAWPYIAAGVCCVAVVGVFLVLGILVWKFGELEERGDAQDREVTEIWALLAKCRAQLETRTLVDRLVAQSIDEVRESAAHARAADRCNTDPQGGDANDDHLTAGRLGREHL